MSQFQGINFLRHEAKEPLYSLPKDWVGLKIALKLVGGVGDVTIAIGSAAKRLKEQPCHITAMVMEHQMSLVGRLEGVDEVNKATALNEPAVRANFDCILDFEGVFNSSRELKARNYYDLVSERLGLTVKPGTFKLNNYKILPPSDRPYVAVHPGASHINRRWINARWKELAKELILRGLTVVWLGTDDELGFVGPYSIKLSNQWPSLTDQLEALKQCTYFIGCDSGFAHLAGLLSVPGIVIFTATSAKHVIAEYPYLTGLERYTSDKYEIGELYPSRSLRGLDLVASEVKSAITVRDVLQISGLDQVETTPIDVLLDDSEKPLVYLFCEEVNTELHNHLSAFCKVEIVTRVYSADFGPVFFMDEGGICFEYKGRVIRVQSINHVQRALREIVFNKK